MARYLHGGIADYVISVGASNAATLVPGASVTCWNASSGGTQYTDLTDTDGVTPIPGGTLTADATGAVPEFYGPDGVTEMYLDANSGLGPRRRTLATDLRAYGDNTFLSLAGGDVTGTVTYTLGASTSVVVASSVSGDTFDQYRRDASGRQDWGPGNAARDTNLYRAAANVLATDDNFRIIRALSTDPALSVRVSGDTTSRAFFTAGGGLNFGSGMAAADTSLYRDAADSLRTDDSLTVGAVLKHLGSQAGFYGTTPAARPTVTGSRGGNAALASLLTALATLGLITDSTTA